MTPVEVPTALEHCNAKLIIIYASSGFVLGVYLQFGVLNLENTLVVDASGKYTLHLYTHLGEIVYLKST